MCLYTCKVSDSGTAAKVICLIIIIIIIMQFLMLHVSVG